MNDYYKGRARKYMYVCPHVGVTYLAFASSKGCVCQKQPLLVSDQPPSSKQTNVVCIDALHRQSVKILFCCVHYRFLSKHQVFTKELTGGHVCQNKLLICGSQAATK
jgi:hypothetical protein